MIPVPAEVFTTRLCPPEVEFFIAKSRGIEGTTIVRSAVRVPVMTKTQPEAICACVKVWFASEMAIEVSAFRALSRSSIAALTVTVFFLALTRCKMRNC